jgi:hypothetical protein
MRISGGDLDWSALLRPGTCISPFPGQCIEIYKAPTGM